MSTIANTIAVAKVTSVLASEEISKGNLYPNVARTEERYPLMITTEYMVLEGVYSRVPNYSGLQVYSDYVYDLCAPFLAISQAIVDGGGGGSIIPVTPTLPAVNSIDWIVSGSASGTAPLATGNTTVTFDGTGGMPDLRGYNMDFFRGGILQYTTNPGDGSTYYSWNRITGVFTLLGTTPSANTGEPMRISPIR